MSATVQCPRGAMERACHAFDQMAWPCRVQPPRHIEGIEYIMWRIGDAQSCERHRQKPQIKGALWAKRIVSCEPKNWMNGGSVW
jgi:hypothetical protein